MTRQERRQMEREFFNYKSNREQAAEYVASSALNGFAIDYTHERVKASKGNSAERAILSAISKEERMWRWCKVFEKTLDKYRWEQKDKLIVMKYIDGKSRWQIVNELSLDISTYHRWIHDILDTAYLWAKEFYLL